MLSKDFLVEANVVINAYNLENYPSIKSGDTVVGYYVKSRGCHYILQQWNDNGYDERWEASKWVEIYENTITQLNAK